MCNERRDESQKKGANLSSNKSVANKFSFVKFSCLLIIAGNRNVVKWDEVNVSSDSDERTFLSFCRSFAINSKWFIFNDANYRNGIDNLWLDIRASNIPSDACERCWSAWLRYESRNKINEKVNNTIKWQRKKNHFRAFRRRCFAQWRNVNVRDSISTSYILSYRISTLFVHLFVVAVVAIACCCLGVYKLRNSI